MYGAIFGDIIGSRFEFDRGGKTKDFELFTNKVCNINYFFEKHNRFQNQK